MFHPNEFQSFKLLYMYEKQDNIDHLKNQT